MNFSYPRMFWLAAVALPAIGLFLWASWRKRQTLIAQFVQSRLLAQLTVGVSRQMQRTRLILLFCAVTFVFLAMCGPQWGFIWEEASTRGRDILVAIDTSRSMLAEDVAPNRLTRAKLAAIDLMRLAKQDRLGMIAFAGSAFLQCPLTLDEEAFRQSVNVLDTGIIPQGGTSLSEAIEVALNAFGKEERQNHKVLVLFTDGEDHETGALDAAKKAAEKGMRIFTIGVGTANGELLRIRDEKGALAYVKDDQGNAVKSRLDEKLLQGIATEANGFYLPLQGANTMETLYQRGLAPLPTSELSSKMVKKFRERFQWPLGIALLFLIGELFLPDRKTPKRVAATTQNSALMAILLFLIFGANSAPASPAKAMRDYKAGHFKDSANEYSRLLEKQPEDPRLHFNAGSAAYQAKEYDKAVKEFSTAVGSPNIELQQSSYYNLGNTLYRAGEQDSESQKKSEAWEQAVKSYDSALKLNPKDTDAAYNRDVVKKRLEELKKQQDQKKDNKQQNQKDDKDKDDQKKEDNKDQQSKDKSDKSKEDQNQQQKDKSDEQKKDGQKSEEQKQQEAKDQAQNEPKPGEKPGDKEKESPQPGQKDREDAAEAKEAAEEASAAKKGVMTQRQAQQLLDAQRSDEKALIFVPP
ncbi:MAG: Mg-chelatase subunit ChlD, partial [Verrucomicrobiales bacterium]|nr:Mg-chelatase subunit ChlD [Verrucomicrobiales bacterium]